VGKPALCSQRVVPRIWQTGGKNGACGCPRADFCGVDHGAPTRSGDVAPDIRRMIANLAENAGATGIRMFDLHDPRIMDCPCDRSGTRPDIARFADQLRRCHTSTHGAFDAFAFAVGATEVAHIPARQAIWQKLPRAMRITFDGALGGGSQGHGAALNFRAGRGCNPRGRVRI
jgi:3-isopropylmalate/(R)-2-methylmalate dehydratase large subunit